MNNFKFLGIGSAFSKDFSPTSMTWTNGNDRFFFEANSSTLDFMKRNKLNNDTYMFLITHFHEDHAGCLGNCIAWLIYAVGVDCSKIYVESPDRELTRQYLSITMPGVENKINCSNKYEKFTVEHTNMPSVGFRVENIAYTGDCKYVPQDILDEFNAGKIVLITECSLNKHVDVHQYLPDLLRKINLTWINNLYLVHHDSVESFGESVKIMSEACRNLDVKSAFEEHHHNMLVNWV